MVDFELVNGQRNGKLLIHRNYVYNTNGRKDSKNLWRCRIRECRGKCEVGLNNVITVTHDHNHEALNEDEVEALRVQSRFREMARASDDKTLNIVTRNLTNVRADVIKILPKERSLNRTVQRVRQAALPGFVPTIPEIPESMWFNNRGEFFFARILEMIMSIDMSFLCLIFKLTF